jgi:cation diffusion facilitator family transporter
VATYLQPRAPRLLDERWMAQPGYAPLSTEDDESDGSDASIYEHDAAADVGRWRRGRARRRRRQAGAGGGPSVVLSAEARLIIALILNLAYTVAELGAYYAFDSLTMLTDAVHNLSDVVAIIIAYKIESLKRGGGGGGGRAAARLSFGARRAECLGGLLNGVVLLTLCFYIVCDAVPRFFAPPIMQITPIFIVIAAAGVPINIVSALLFVGSAVTPQHAHAHGSDGSCPSAATRAAGGAAAAKGQAWKGCGPGIGGNLNLWAVFLHSLGDALTSVGVTCTALLIYAHSRHFSVAAGSCTDGVVLTGSLDGLSHYGPQERHDGVVTGNVSDEGQLLVAGIRWWPQEEGGAGQLGIARVTCQFVDFVDPAVSVFLSLLIGWSVLPLLRRSLPVVLDQAPAAVDLPSLR